MIVVLMLLSPSSPQNPYFIAFAFLGLLGWLLCSPVVRRSHDNCHTTILYIGPFLPSLLWLIVAYNTSFPILHTPAHILIHCCVFCVVFVHLESIHQLIPSSAHLWAALAVFVTAAAAELAPSTRPPIAVMFVMGLVVVGGG